MSAANIVAQIHWNFSNKKALNTAELCACEYVTLPQSFHRGIFSIP